MDKEREALVERLRDDPVRAALIFCLWHHQGGSSRIGQAIRLQVGLGEHEHLSDDQLATAKAVQAALTAQQEPVACCCGEPLTLGVVHRKDSPCFHWQNLPGTTQPADGVVSREEMIRAAKWLENAAAKSVSRREYLLAATALLAAAKELRK